MAEDVTHELSRFNPAQPSFEEQGRENGQRYWWASCFQILLGYTTAASFRQAINRAVAAMTTLGLPVEDNVCHTKRDTEHGPVPDTKLSRIACYFIAINADGKKPEVLRAQAYFVALAETFRHHIEAQDGMERMLARGEISQHEKTLVGVANQHGVDDFALFQSAGYRGLYNMTLTKLKQVKGLSADNFKRSLLDFMGKDELAANLFRITQTELKIKKDGIHGQHRLEAAAETVGREVRDAMRRISGVTPESLPLSTDIRDTHKKMKGAARNLHKIDAKKKPRSKG